MNKDFVKNIPHIWLLIVGLLVGVFSYSFGVIQAHDQRTAQIAIIYPPESAVKEVMIESESQSSNLETEGVFASKNGTKYYTPGCSGISRINAENLVQYTSEAEAIEAGLELAKTCQ